MSKRQRARLIRIGVYTATLALLVYLAFTVDWSRLQEVFFDPTIFFDQFPKIITQAAWHTVIFTVFGFSLGLIIGLTLAIMRLSSIRPYRWFAAVYIEIFRGLPMLLTLYIVGYGIPIALQGTRVPFTYGPGSVGIAIVLGAYMAENIRGGIQAVPKGQMEAARSLGMGYGRAMSTVVVPQAFRIMLPTLTNELVLTIKDTSLISVLGVSAATLELTKFARNGVEKTLNLTPFVAAGVVYLAMTIPLTRVASYLERRAKQAR